MLSKLRDAIAADLEGTVVSIGSQTITLQGLRAPVGADCIVSTTNGESTEAIVVAADRNELSIAPLAGTGGITIGARATLKSVTPSIAVGEELLGRVVDCYARPLEGSSAIATCDCQPLTPRPLSPTERVPINQVLHTGVRAIDSFLTVGRGQRIGIFAGTGVGKSSLLGMLARGTEADVVVLGMIGERGREVQDFLEHEIDEPLRPKCVTVVETGEQPAARRLRAAQTATAIAEYFRDQGKHVLLLVDSITRCAQAQREIGLAAGEPPATRGFPPSVFAVLPKLVERAGTVCLPDARVGSITGIYNVLVEGDDPNEPISDTMRGVLDGHIQLSRSLAEQGHYPAIDIPASISRLQSRLLSKETLGQTQRIRRRISDYRDHEDLINIGAYQDGANPRVDQAIACKPAIDDFLRQTPTERYEATQIARQLDELAN